MSKIRRTRCQRRVNEAASVVRRVLATQIQLATSRRVIVVITQPEGKLGAQRRVLRHDVVPKRTHTTSR